MAIGPGNSVSAATCQDPSGKERYPASPRQWQVYVSRAFARIGPDKELECPGEALDYGMVAVPLVWSPAFSTKKD